MDTTTFIPLLSSAFRGSRLFPFIPVHYDIQAFHPSGPSKQLSRPGKNAFSSRCRHGSLYHARSKNAICSSSIFRVLTSSGRPDSFPATFPHNIPFPPKKIPLHEEPISPTHRISLPGKIFRFQHRQELMGKSATALPEEGPKRRPSMCGEAYRKRPASPGPQTVP